VNTYKIILEYDGSRYSGWQEQRNAKTVMGELRKAAVEVFGGPVEMQGAGRTDAGVHALGQAMHVKAEREGREESPKILCARLNERLPADIAVLSVERAYRGFHARHDALGRVYLYQISTRKQAFTKKLVWWVKEDLDVPAMARAAGSLVGRHDFAAFRAADPSRPGESTVVVVHRAEIETAEDIVQFRIEASHFLWRMARRIVGVLVQIGRGAIGEDDLARLLSGQSDPRLDVAAWTAPSAGLFLERVIYAEEPSIPGPGSAAAR
jgi:tRNA pseudouridine38-40 synthase